jgi:hypothetical protein
LVVVLAADGVLATGPFLLKTGGNIAAAFWIASAFVAVSGVIVRAVLRKKSSPCVEKWRSVLRPSVFGAVVVAATAGFMLVVLPLVVLANK